MSSRRLSNLISRLPQKSETVAALAGHETWSTTEHILATIADYLIILDWHFVCANSEPGKAPDFPGLYPRPGDEDSDSTSPGGTETRDLGTTVVDPTMAVSVFSNFMAFETPDSMPRNVKLVTPEE